jgi:hypothetical protein
VTAEQELSVQKLETLFDLTSHKGWIELHKDLSEKMDFIKDQLCIRELSAYELGKAHGYLDLSRELQNLRAFAEYTLAQVKENVEADAI